MKKSIFLSALLLVIFLGNVVFAQNLKPYEKRRIKRKAKRQVKRYVRGLNRIGKKPSSSKLKNRVDDILNKLIIEHRENAKVYDDFSEILTKKSKKEKKPNKMIPFEEYLKKITSKYKNVRFSYSGIKARDIDQNNLPEIKTSAKNKSLYLFMLVTKKYLQAERFNGEIDSVNTKPLQIRVNFDSTGKTVTGIEQIKPFNINKVQSLFTPYRWSLGLRTGFTSFIGDIRTSWRLNKSKGFRPGAYFGVDIQHRYNNRFTVGGSLTYNYLQGDDAVSPESSDRRKRNLNFINQAMELSLFTQMDILYDRRFHYRYHFTPYWIVGGSLLWHTPSPLRSNKYVNLRKMTTENRPKNDKGEPVSYKVMAPTVFTGVGIKWRDVPLISRFAPGFDISLEATIRFPFTEYLDDVSSTWVNVANLPNDLSRRLADRSAEGSDDPSLGNFYTGSDGKKYLSKFTPNDQGQVRRALENRPDFFILFGIRLGYVFGR